jgi:glutathione S-transferase
VILHYHPLSSYCHKVLIALDVLGIAVEKRLLNLEDADARAAQAREQLMSAYSFINKHMQGRTWASGDAFSMADCAAAPALFYAVTYVPLRPEHEHLASYFERLLQHPSVVMTIDQARPWFKFYPGRAGLAARFFDATKA